VPCRDRIKGIVRATRRRLNTIISAEYEQLRATTTYREGYFSTSLLRLVRWRPDCPLLAAPEPPPAAHPVAAPIPC
jgi:hypothetical protein